MLFVTKPDIFCIPCKLRVCKFPKNSMDVNYMHTEIKDQGMNLRTCTVVIHTILWKYHFMEICKPPVKKPIGSYQIHHLKQCFLFGCQIWQLAE